MADQEGAQKPTEDWVTGDDDATPAQKSYEQTLAEQAGEDVDVENQTKAEASDTIDDLEDQVDGAGN